MRFVTHRVIPESDLPRWCAPRDEEIVAEREIEPGRFVAAEGPFERYERTCRADRDGAPEGQVVVEQTVDFKLAAPFWRLGLEWPIRWRLGRQPGSGRPWWFWVPPDRFDPRASTMLALLCLISLGAGYVGTLLTQTMTYAADEFDAGRAAQGTVLAAVRVGVFLALIVTARADRIGRRRQLIVSGVGAALVTLTGAIAPSLLWLGVSQAVARGFATSLQLLVGIVSAEEMPRDSRAYAVSLVSMSSALGAGFCLLALPLADTGPYGWRLLYLLPMVTFPIVVWVLRRLPESQRFVRTHVEAPMSGHGRRFWLLAVSGFFLAAFAAPATGFQNEFLRDERAYSAVAIVLFVILTNTPGGLSIIVGGRLADLHGRRLIGAIGIVGGTLFTVAQFATESSLMWAASLAATLTGAMVVPALGVYRPELFPTSLRGRAGGLMEVLTVAGSSVGLLAVGTLSDTWDSFAWPMALLSVGSLFVAVLVLTVYPETAHQTLEDLNPEDRSADNLSRDGPAPEATP